MANFEISDYFTKVETNTTDWTEVKFPKGIYKLVPNEPNSVVLKIGTFTNAKSYIDRDFVLEVTEESQTFQFKGTISPAYFWYFDISVILDLANKLLEFQTETDNNFISDRERITNAEQLIAGLQSSFTSLPQQVTTSVLATIDEKLPSMLKEEIKPLTTELIQDMDTKLNAAKTELNTTIETNIASAKAELSSQVDTKVATVKTELSTSLSSEIDTKVEAAKTAISADVTSQLNTAKTEISADTTSQISKATTEMSTNIDTKVSEATTTLNNTITTEVTKTKEELGEQMKTSMEQVLESVNTSLNNTVGGLQTTLNNTSDVAYANKSHIGTLTDLTTTNKSDLVSAINEVKNSAGSGGSSTPTTVTLPIKLFNYGSTVDATTLATSQIGIILPAGVTLTQEWSSGTSSESCTCSPFKIFTKGDTIDTTALPEGYIGLIFPS